MKRILLIAALVAAALVGRAQSEADNVSVMLRHLQDTNAEVARINDALKLHTVMVFGGGAVMTVGLLYAASATSERHDVVSFDAKKMRTGLLIAAVGGVVMLSSAFAMPKGVTLDGRGLIVRPSEVAKKKK